ncbi:MAG: iron chelate uptake ABC transporter family permease subunit [Planctomycetaceae bacterium]|jgi:manganese/zinc/iron transport system permease protein|nr:metal ABC transporter permease [Planctomycetaceae bacterium]MDG2390008.1 iron chelate uptake ABC transporter family permease subunit [Planctomycetaceae bacterium]
MTGASRNSSRLNLMLVLVVIATIMAPSLLLAQETRTVSDRLWRTVSLQDYNTRIVLMGTCLLGISGGVVGTFMLLRKRSLVGDVVGHASLPGIGIAYLVMESMESGSGKSLPGLLTGAFICGLCGALCTLAIKRYTRIKDDAALAIVLSIFFGVGVALFTIVQRMSTGNAAGLHQFVFGKTSSLLANDVKLFAGLAVLVIVVTIFLFKEMTILSFDQEFAHVQGWPVLLLDSLLMGLIVLVTVIGLQSVGLLLVVALPVIPAAAARFWTDSLRTMSWISAGIGGVSAIAGVVLSATFPLLSTGPMIVLSGSLLFTISMLFGTQRGVLTRLRRLRLSRIRHGRLDLLRACYEHLEQKLPEGMMLHSDQMTDRMLTLNSLLSRRTWKPARVQSLLNRAIRDDLLLRKGEAGYQLTEEGATRAVRAARNHRMWELFLIRYAEIAPSHVDRDADMIEHVLSPDVLEELETALGQQYPHLRVPDSPHTI